MSRFLLSLFITFHLTAITLHNFPWSPLIERLYPYYSGYIHASGQTQGWGMYIHPFHEDPLYEVRAGFADGVREILIGRPGKWEEARHLYFAEGLFFMDRNASLYADAFLNRLYDKYPPTRKPKSITVSYHRREVPSLRDWTSKPREAYKSAGNFTRSWS